METQDVTERHTTANAFAERDHVTFGGTREIRRTMAAARTIMGKSDGADRWSPSCRLVGHPERHEVEVLATDGNRAMRMRVAAERSRPGDMFDEPLHGDAVRAMARTTTPVLTVTATGDALVITEGNGTERRFPKAVRAGAHHRALRSAAGHRRDPALHRERTGRCRQYFRGAELERARRLTEGRPVSHPSLKEGA